MDYFQIVPGGVEVVLLVITSHAQYRESEEAQSDVRLWIVWGPNLTLDSWGGIEDATAEGGHRMDIPVADDFTREETAFIWTWVIISALIVKPRSLGEIHHCWFRISSFIWPRT